MSPYTHHGFGIASPPLSLLPIPQPFKGEPYAFDAPSVDRPDVFKSFFDDQRIAIGREDLKPSDQPTPTDSHGGLGRADHVKIAVAGSHATGRASAPELQKVEYLDGGQGDQQFPRSHHGRSLDRVIRDNHIVKLAREPLSPSRALRQLLDIEDGAPTRPSLRSYARHTSHLPITEDPDSLAAIALTFSDQDTDKRPKLRRGRSWISPLSLKKIGNPFVKLSKLHNESHPDAGNRERDGPHTEPEMKEKGSAESTPTDVALCEALGWTWGGSSRSMWGQNEGKTTAVETPQKYSIEDNSETPTHERKRLSKDGPDLSHWSNFIKAYADALMDLNVPPPVPTQGSPDPFLMPNWVKSMDGPLFAPKPEWEKERQATLDRLQLDKMPQQRWNRIKQLCDELRLHLGTMATLFTILDEGMTRLHCVSPDGVEIGSNERRKTLCGHAVLNRHEGLVINDVLKDWRCNNNPVLEGLRFYAAMPVCASDGLPIGMLCCVDTKAKDHFAPQDRMKMKELANAIGAEIELWSVESFLEKMQRLESSWRKLEGRILDRPNIPCGAKIFQRPPGSLLQTGDEDTGSEEIRDLARIDRRSISALGIPVTCGDVALINYCAKLVSEAAFFETVYLVAVEPAAKKCTLMGKHGSGQILGSALHVEALRSVQGEIVYPRPDATEASRLVSGAQFQAGILCPVETSSHGTVLSETSAFDSETGLRGRDLRGCERYAPQRMARTSSPSKFGFVLVALTTDGKRVIGIEDLRYLQGFATVVGALLRKSCDPVDGDTNLEAATFASSQAEALHHKRSSQEPCSQHARKDGQGRLSLLKGLHRQGQKPFSSSGSNLGPDDGQSQSSDDSTRSRLCNERVTSSVSLRIVPDTAAVQPCVGERLEPMPMGFLPCSGLRPAPRQTKKRVLSS